MWEIVIQAIIGLGAWYFDHKAILSQNMKFLFFDIFWKHKSKLTGLKCREILTVFLKKYCITDF